MVFPCVPVKEPAVQGQQVGHILPHDNPLSNTH
jgi:hypothetical protein